MDPEDEDDEAGRQLKTVDGYKNATPQFKNNLIQWGSTDFRYGVTRFGAREQGWIGLPPKKTTAELPELETP